jgi:3-hydroxyacyl-[acyl-carrier-protein] dehydratase
MKPQQPSDALYRIEGQKPGSELSCWIEFNPDHPVLRGHFPGNPVVPGAWLIRCVHDAMEMATGKKLSMTKASQVKFLKPVLASHILKVNLEGTLSAKDKNEYDVNAVISIPEQVFMKLRATFTILLAIH